MTSQPEGTPGQPAPETTAQPAKRKGRGGHGKSGGRSKRPAKANAEIATTGRPHLLDEALAKEILDAIANGQPESRAAMAAGVTPSAVTKWKTRGRLAHHDWDKLDPEKQAREAIYVTFFKGIRDAAPKFERHHLGIVNEGAKKDWRASMRLLETHPATRDTWGKRVMLGGDPENKTPIPVKDTSEMSAEERVARARRVLDADAKRRRGQKKV